MKDVTAYRFWVDTNVLVVSYFDPDNTQEQGNDIAPIALLAETMIEDSERSQLIFHLNDKTWVSVPLLYDLVTQVMRYHPISQINWLKSFLEAELDRLASQYADDNYIPQHTKKEVLKAGEVSARDLNESNLMRLEYRRAISPQVIAATKGRILTELTSRGILQA